MTQLLLMYGNEMPSTAHIEHLQDLVGKENVILATSESIAVQQAESVEIILGHRYLCQTLPHTRCLKWVQSTAAGVQHLAFPDLFRISPILTRCPIFAPVVAFHAVTLAFSLLRRIPDAVMAQQNGVWAQPFDMLPCPKTAMVFGMGYIGRAISELLKSLGIRVLGVARRTTPEMTVACDRLLIGDEWRHFLSVVDLFFIAVPLTTSTVSVVDKAVMKALPEHALLVDTSRGGVVDTSALIELLKAGHLGGAALDVLEHVPDSPDDPLWKTPRLLITPKVSVYYPERQARLEAFVEGQVLRYLEGKTPLHMVDLARLVSESIGTFR